MALTREPKVRYRYAVSPRYPRESSSELVDRRQIADRDAMALMLGRMAREIVESNGGAERVALVGIRRGGLHLAKRLQHLIESAEGQRPSLGAVDITLYRDDVFIGLPRPDVGPTDLPFELTGSTIVLVDDVLFTGRTVRAALDALMDFGRPRKVQLAVLVDRGMRELPIAADYVGQEVATSENDSVRVFLSETGENDRVILRTRIIAGEAL